VHLNALGHTMQLHVLHPLNAVHICLPRQDG
jgi:hypothetical protein